MTDGDKNIEAQNPTTPSQNLELVATQSRASTRDDIPPDGGYGWVVTISFFLINAHTWGVNSAWGIFLAYFLSSSAFPAATQLEYAIVGGLSLSMCCLITPAVGLSNDKLGTRGSLLIGTFLISLSMLTSSFATAVWHLMLSQGVCFGFGLGFLYFPAAPIVPQWFLKKRSLAVGIASAGAGVGGIIYNLGSAAAVETMGWRWTYRVLAICTGAVNFVCSFLLRDRNKVIETKSQVFEIREYKHISIWLIIFWGVFTELGYIVLLYSLPDYARSIGLSAKQGSVVGAVLNVGLAFGRPAIGWLSDRFGRIDVATAGTALCGIYCLAIWVPAQTYAVLLIFALASGTVTGIFWGTITPVTAEVVGLKRLPQSFLMLCLPLVIPTVFAEPIALQMASTSGYLSAKVFVGFMYIAGSLCMFALRSWKLCDMENEEGEIEMEDRNENETDQSRSQEKKSWLTPRRLFANKRI